MTEAANEGSLLSAERENYWKNRLTNTCVRASGLQGGCTQRDLYQLVINGYGIYNYEACGHSACHSCQTTHLLKEANCPKCKIPRGEVSVLRPTGIAQELALYQKEALNIMQQKYEDIEKKKNELEKSADDLKTRVDRGNKKQQQLEEENTILKIKLESSTKRELGEMIDTTCMDCGYSVVFERSRICVSCGIEKEFLAKVFSEDGEEKIKIISFDKAEVSLLCGTCVLERGHGKHKTVNYFELKTDQLLLTHYNDVNCRLDTAFDRDWDNVCKKMNECHLPVVELLTKPTKDYKKQESWMNFQKTQIKQKHIVQRMVENKAKMVGHIHKYTGEMKTILSEAHSLLQDAIQNVLNGNLPDDQEMRGKNIDWISQSNSVEDVTTNSHV